MRRTLLNSLAVGLSLVTSPAFAAAPDGFLTSKVKLSLWTTAGVKSSDVHVDTNDGAVTLYGKVATQEQRVIAEKTTREIVGVQSVKNLLQVVAAVDAKRTERNDKDTLAMVEKSLKGDAALKDSSISVKAVDKGTVLLVGNATTISDLQRAVALVDRVPGVDRVASEVKTPDAFGDDERGLLVTSKAAPAAGRSSVSDARVSASVKLRLLTAAQIPSTEISVDTDEGVVTLFGMVPTADVKNSAGLEASKVAGVVGVQNQLEVVATSQKKAVVAKDADVTRDLALAFKTRPELNAVSTAVKSGVVRLTGSVESGWDEVTAVRVARQVAGVRAVENQVKVSPPAAGTPTPRN
jgi:hyperosmotically inducible protein